MKISSIKNIAEFNLVNKHGIKYISPIFTLIIMPNFANINASILHERYLVKNLSGSQPLLARLNDHSLFLGFKISKKIGNAVKRNKLKRQIKALYQLAAKRPANGYLGGSAVIIIARQAIKVAKFGVLTTEIDKAVNYFKRKIVNV